MIEYHNPVMEMIDGKKCAKTTTKKLKIKS